MMNRKSIFLFGLTWLILILIIGCVPAMSEAEPALAPAEESGAGEGVLVTVVPPTAIEPETEAATAVPQPTNTSPPIKPTIELTIAAPEAPKEASVPVKPTIDVPDNPSIQENVQQAKDDLIQRLNVNLDQINLVEYQSVTWRDGSMGCPQPGMAYTQALREGYRLQLQVGSQQYNYHGAAGRAPFLCKNPDNKGNYEAPATGGGDT